MGLLNVREVLIAAMRKFGFIVTPHLTLSLSVRFICLDRPLLQTLPSARPDLTTDSLLPERSS
jgi:hypothetical protein